MYVYLAIALLVAIKAAYTLYKLFINRLKYSAIPQAPVDNFFYGHKPSIEKAKKENTALELFVRWTNTYGPTLVLWMKIDPFIFTSDPTMLKEITTDIFNYIKVRNLPNRTLYGQTLVGYDSILTGGGVDWATKRKFMSTFFSKGNLQELFMACKPHMKVNQLARWRGIVGAGKTVNLHDQLSITFTSYLQVLGLGSYSNPEIIANQVDQILNTIKDQKSSLWLFKPPNMFLKNRTRMIDMVKQMRGELAQLIHEEKSTEVSGNNTDLETTDLLGHLVRANIGTNKGKNGNKKRGKGNQKGNRNTSGKMTEIVEMTVNDLMTVFLVFDNLTKQIASLFMLLKDVPEVQERMAQELRDNPINEFEDLAKLKYTEQCILEGMRMRPALLKGTRQYRVKNRKFGCYKIGKTSIVVFSQYVMHHSEKYWDKPYVFNPERWNDGFIPPQGTYIPFLAGPRSCLAKHVAMMLMKLTLSVLLSNFHVTQDFDKENPPVMNQNYAVMRIQNEVACHFKPIL